MQGLAWGKHLIIRREIRKEIASTLRELSQSSKGTSTLSEIERELSSSFQAEVRAMTPNPRNPDFPSTSVRLNRDHPVVRAALVNARMADFQPIKIPGGPLSDDIIRDRR